MKKHKEGFSVLCLVALIIISSAFITQEIQKGNQVAVASLATTEVAATNLAVEVAKFPIRHLVIDTYGKNIISTDAKLAASLKEISDTGAVKDIWSVEYEKKGNSRAVCVPPPLNLKFEKVKKNGDPKLFYGNSTYYSSGTLGYRKIRLIPECELWEGFFTNAFRDKLPHVTLREYMSFNVLRAFGVSTLDIVGFADVTFVSTDKDIDGTKKYRYLMVQRDSEDKDQIPFTSQFNLDPTKLVEAVGQDDYTSKVSANGGIKGDHLTFVGRNVGGTYKNFPLDPESTVRFFIIEDLIGAGDHFPFWNEDYAPDAQTGLYKIIPYSYDIALDYGSHDEDHLIDLIKKLPEGEQQKYKDLFYKNAREIFDDPNSLKRILLSIDRFPFDVDKGIVTNFMKLRFHTLALYYGSKEFSEAMGQTHVPFIHQDEYLKANPEVLKLKGFSDSVDTLQKDSIRKSTLSYAPVLQPKVEVKTEIKTEVESKTPVSKVSNPLYFAPPPSTDACYNFLSTLKIGDHNNDVVALQEVLYRAGFGRTLTAENTYSDMYSSFVATRVRNFQISRNIDPTGSIGPVTRTALNATFGCGKQNAHITLLDLPTSVMKGGDMLVLQWITFGISGVNKIDLIPTAAGQATISVFNSSENTSALTTNSYTWKIPTTVASGNYKVKITAKTTYTDTSKTTLTIDNSGKTPADTKNTLIQAEDAIVITTPTLGNVLKKGDKVKVTWTTPASLTSVTIGINLKSASAADRGSLHAVLSNPVYSARTGSFTWTVPTNIGDGPYYISIYTGSKEWKSATFSIVPPQSDAKKIKLSTPNGGTNAVFFKESKYPIGWNATTSVLVSLRIKNVDSGALIPITTVKGIVGENIYSWLISPTITPGKYKVQIVLEGQVAVESDNYFSIADIEPTINYIYPTAGPIGTIITVYGHDFAIGKNLFVFDCNNSGFNLVGNSTDGKVVTVPLVTQYTNIQGKSCFITPDENNYGNYANFTVYSAVSSVSPAAAPLYSPLPSYIPISTVSVSATVSPSPSVSSYVSPSASPSVTTSPSVTPTTTTKSTTTTTTAPSSSTQARALSGDHSLVAAIFYSLGDILDSIFSK